MDKSKWVITQKEINTMRECLCKKQDGLCAITKDPMKRPVLDHDHDLGYVRQVLESRVNMIEGKFLKLYNKYISKHTKLTFGEFLIAMGEYLSLDYSSNKLHGAIIDAERRKISRWKKETIYNKLMDKGLTLLDISEYNQGQLVHLYLQDFIFDVEKE